MPSWQDVCKKPLGKIPATDLHALSLCKVCRRGVLARSLYKSFIRGLLARILQGVSWQDLNRYLCNVSVQDLFMKSPTQALWKSSLGKIYVRDLLARSLQQVSMRCLCTRSPKEVSWQDLCTRSPYEVYWQDREKRSLHKRLPQKISVRHPRARSLFKLL